ncbi:unnamed protein product [Rotaria socialis]|uniref:Uncharacterized protein n=1 Tax=Rotaria socialis TaxID=392032 RepID=A0A820MFU4_9BILA|nr:unnamed protein product [Rotaria socialis]CAF4374330.1 unnamed protein product [Rotaria socialis]
MSTSDRDDDSNDEFESADEGEPTTPPITKSETSLPLPTAKPATPPPPPVIRPATPPPPPVIRPATPPPPPVHRAATPPPPPVIRHPTTPPVSKPASPPPLPASKSVTPPPLSITKVATPPSAITFESSPKKMDPSSSSTVAKPLILPPALSPSDPKPSLASDNQVQSRPDSPIVTDGWDDWNIDDEQPIETSIKISKTLNQDSISSHSSTPSKVGDNLSLVGSDEDDQSESFDQLHVQRKKYHKEQADLNLNKEDNKLHTQVSTSNEQQHQETSSSIKATKKHEHDVKDAHRILDQLAEQTPKNASTWHNPWSNFGSLLSTAKQSVSTLTNTVSEGFSAVIESVEAGLGAPDPQKLAEMNQMAFKIKGETSDSEDEPEVTTNETENDDFVTNQDGWLNALSIGKLTNTGMKVVAGSLDVLETVGKKTFDVINEADPALKGTRGLLRKQNQPTLSEIIREAETKTKTKTTTTKIEATTFLQLFEKHQGLAHFEALELLSNQSSITLQTMSHGNEKFLEQINHYFLLEDDDDDQEINNALDSSTVYDSNDNNRIPSLEIVSQKFTTYQTQLRSTVSVDKLLEVYESANQFLTEWDWSDTELDQKTLSDEAIDSLAILCARIIEYYRKTAELFLMGCKSLTSFSIDIELLAIYEKQQKDFSNMLAGIPNLFAKYMKQASSGADMPIRCDIKLKQKLLNQMFIQSSSSQTYAFDAYALLKPIVSQSILYHTSTTR